MIWLAVALLAGQTADVPEPVAAARSLLEQGRGLEALETLEAASRDHPADPRIWYELGALYGAAGRAREALTALEKAVELAPDDKEYALAFGELLFRAGQAEAALPYLERAAALPPLPEGLLLLAATQEKLGRTGPMFETLTQYLALEPDDVNVRSLLGDKLESEKRYEEALAVYRDAVAIGADVPRFLYRAASILGRSLESYAEAESLVRRALEKEPQMLEARLLLARLLERTDRSEEALSELERARTEHPETPQVYYRLSQALQRAGRTSEATEAATRFQELSAAEKAREEREARVAVTYKQAAEALSRGDMLEAESVFRSVLEIEPEHAQTESMLAKIAYSKGDAEAATAWIGKAIEHAPEVAEYHYLLALFLSRSGELSDVEPSLNRALELDPAFPDAWSLLGKLLLDAGRAREAAASFSKAAALEPDNPVTQLNLASAYAAAGETENERAAMERYRELSLRP